jgi:hypothetical protein
MQATVSEPDSARGFRTRRGALIVETPLVITRRADSDP